MTRQLSSGRVPATTLALLLGISVAEGQETGQQPLAGLTMALEDGVQGIVAHVTHTRAPVPLIYSRWYVETMLAQPPERLESERAKREFGRLLVLALDRYAAELLELKTSRERELGGNLLLDLGDWIGSRPGYGNMFLLHRCQDIATVPIAHLIADLAFPMAKLDKLVSRFMSQADQLTLNAKALSTESPVRFEPGSGNIPAKWWLLVRHLNAEQRRAEGIRGPMVRTWRRNGQRIIEWRRAQGDPMPHFWLEGAKHRRALPKELQFFCDDDASRGLDPFTTLKQWDRKLHYRLLMGIGAYSNCEGVKNLLLFRRKVGGFPTKPPPGSMVDSFIKDPIKRAFDAAWQPYRLKHGPIYGSAARVYNEVKSNTFWDQDTRERRVYDRMHRKP